MRFSLLKGRGHKDIYCHPRGKKWATAQVGCSGDRLELVLRELSRKESETRVDPRTLGFLFL